MPIEESPFSTEVIPNCPSLLKSIEAVQQTTLEAGIFSPTPVIAMVVNGQLSLDVIPYEIMKQAYEEKNTHGVQMLEDGIRTHIRQTDPESCAYMAQGYAALVKADDHEAVEALEAAKAAGEMDVYPDREEIVMISLKIRKPKEEVWLGKFSIIRDSKKHIHNFSRTEWCNQDGRVHIHGVFTF